MRPFPLFGIVFCFGTIMMGLPSFVETTVTKVTSYHHNAMKDGTTCAVTDSVFSLTTSSVIYCGAYCNVYAGCKSFSYNSCSGGCNGCRDQYNISDGQYVDEGTQYYTDRVADENPAFTSDITTTTSNSTSDISTTKTTSEASNSAPTLTTTSEVPISTTTTATASAIPTTTTTSEVPTYTTTTSEIPTPTKISTIQTSTTANGLGDWKYFEGSYYLYVSMSMTRNDAGNHCKEHPLPSVVNGGAVPYLVVTELETENTFVKDLAFPGTYEQESSPSSIFLGMGYSPMYGISGSESDFTNWAAPPANDGCVLMESDGQWILGDCMTFKAHFVCEFQRR